MLIAKIVHWFDVDTKTGLHLHIISSFCMHTCHLNLPAFKDPLFATLSITYFTKT